MRSASLAALYFVCRDHGLPCPMAMVKGLTDPDADVRLTASAYLGGFKSIPGETHEAMLAAATISPDRLVRANLIQQLPDVMRGHPRLMPALEAGARDSDLFVRNNAHIGILKVTGDFERVLDFHLELMRLETPKDQRDLKQSEKDDWEVTEFCKYSWAEKAQQWSHLNPERYLLALLKRVRSEDHKKRWPAAWLLGVVGSETVGNRDLVNKLGVVKVLESLAKTDPDERVRFYAKKCWNDYVKRRSDWLPSCLARNKPVNSPET